MFAVFLFFVSVIGGDVAGKYSEAEFANLTTNNQQEQG